jgi:hypothetical protein
MEYGNGRVTIVELVTVHISYFRGFLSARSRVLFEQYMLVMLCSAKKSQPAGLAALEHWVDGK